MNRRKTIVTVAFQLGTIAQAQTPQIEQNIHQLYVKAARTFNHAASAVPGQHVEYYFWVVEAYLVMAILLAVRRSFYCL